MDANRTAASLQGKWCVFGETQRSAAGEFGIDTVLEPTGTLAGLGGVTAVKYNQCFLEGRTRFSAMRVCIFFP